MKKVWLLVTVFVTLILFFPIANLAFNRSPQVIEGSLQKIEEKVSMLDTQLKNIEKNTLETYTYITEKQKQLAEKAGTSVELIRTLQNIAASYNIPLELAYEVVRLESNFDPKLTCYNEWNDTYDRGLFQLNDNTSPWLAEKIGIKDFTYDMAYNIELNMKMGLWYLNYLYQKYHNWHDALTAYNRGMYGLKKYKEYHGTSRSAYSRTILKSVEKQKQN